MSKVVFTGCSFTAGNGWTEMADPNESHNLECKDHSDLWVNLCATQLDQLKDLEVVNLGKGGASNAEIFANTVGAIGNFGAEIDTLICQWTSMPRYNFDVGFELWSTREGLRRVKRSKNGVNLNRGDIWSREYLDDILDRFLVLHHLHSEIIKVVEYSSILQKLSQQLNIKLYNVNGMCPWDQNYFVKLSGTLPEEYTPFTKKEILNIESRNDKDIFKLYDIMHNDYTQAGGINPANWVNLYDSMEQTMLDTNYDNRHPGTKSNQLYFKQIKKFLETQ
jgi:hypothetical protein